MKKVKEFFKRRTLTEIILIIITVLFFIQTSYIGTLVSQISDISSNFDSIVGGPRKTRSQSYINIDGNISASIDGNVSIK